MQTLDALGNAHGLGQAEHLGERRVVGDQVEGEEIPAGLGQPSRIPFQASGQTRIAVVAQALGIGDGDQKRIQRSGADVSLLAGVLPHPAVIVPAEMLGHLTQAFRVQDPFGRTPGFLLGWRARVVASATGPRRCPLVTHCPRCGQLDPREQWVANSRALVTVHRERYKRSVPAASVLTRAAGDARQGLR